MKKYFICCQKCFETIGKKNTRAAKLWMDFCAYGMRIGETFEIGNANSKEIGILENLGFIITTERPISLMVKIKGHLMSEDGEHFFCVKEGNHES